MHDAVSRAQQSISKLSDSVTAVQGSLAETNSALNTVSSAFGEFRNTLDKWFKRIFGGIAVTIIIIVLLQIGAVEFFKQLLLGA